MAGALDGGEPGFRPRMLAQRPPPAARRRDAAMGARPDAHIVVIAPVGEIVAAGVAAPPVVGDLVGREAGCLHGVLSQVEERTARVIVGDCERAVALQPPEGRALLDGELIEREVVAGQRQRLRQLRAPGGEALTGTGVDQVEGAARHDALGQRDRAARLRRTVPAPEKAQRIVVQRLDAEGDPVHAGRPKIVQARGLGRGRIGFEGDLRVRRERPPRRRPLDDARHGLGRHQRGCAPAEEDAGDRRPRQQRREMIQLAQQRPPPPGLIDAFPDMAVEVAIGALGEAEGPMDIEGERRRRAIGGRSGGGGHGPGGRHAAANCSKARARWVSGCFSCGVISPKLRPWPSGMKIGS